MHEKSRVVEPERIPSGPRATPPQRACDATPLERLELDEERRKLDALEADYEHWARVAEREHAEAEEIRRHADYVQRELDREGIYADGEPVRVSEDLVELVKAPPLVAGGQGRSDEEVREDAEGLFPAAVAGVALVLFAIAIGVGYWIGRAI